MTALDSIVMIDLFIHIHQNTFATIFDDIEHMLKVIRLAIERIRHILADLAAAIVAAEATFTQSVSPCWRAFWRRTSSAVGLRHRLSVHTRSIEYLLMWQKVSQELMVRWPTASWQAWVA